jgi:hypothetical protein
MHVQFFVQESQNFKTAIEVERGKINQGDAQIVTVTPQHLPHHLPHHLAHLWPIAFICGELFRCWAEDRLDSDTPDCG